jgi:hypothetical protein
VVVVVVVIVTAVAVIIVVTVVVVVVTVEIVIVLSPYLNFITIIVGRELMRTDKGHENDKYSYVFGIVSDGVLREILAQEEECRRLWVCSQISRASILYCRV